MERKLSGRSAMIVVPDLVIAFWVVFALVIVLESKLAMFLCLAVLAMLAAEWVPKVLGP